MAESAGIDFKPRRHGYPHFTYIDDKPKSKAAWVGLEVSGERASDLLNIALSCDVEELSKGNRLMQMATPRGAVEGEACRLGKQSFLLSIKREQYGLAATWLQALSDGYVSLDKGDLHRKAPGPVIVQESARKVTAPKGKGQSDPKPLYIGMDKETREALPDFAWKEPAEAKLRRTALYETHRNLGAKMVPFAGWEMPVWYSSVVEEHLAVRQAAGLFDVTHMGVYDARGPHAAAFLDSVCGNDIRSLKVGESAYTHFLDPDANVIDDLIVYRVGAERYLIVVNASNDEKNWAWLNAVRQGKVCIDRKRPWSLAFGGSVRLRNLRDANAGADMRVDVALQGPNSRKILLQLTDSSKDQKHIRRLKRFGVTEVNLAGLDVILSRTGYTGESMSFEIFINPDQSIELWDALLKAGAAHGIRPCGLGARDSLRTEAGLPLYGNELAGSLNLGVGDSGFRQFMKTYKPWFIGRDAFLEREATRTRQVVRFRFQKTGVRMAHLGDPVTNSAGELIGHVTSCSIDSERFLTGQAVVDKKFLKEGTPLLIYQGLGEKPIPEGAQPTEAVVISRMMG
ncbi:MAG: glycine cleavage system aminomethyltransferase GcvT [Anaerolineales bacterium]